MAQLTLTQRSDISQQAEFQGRVRAWLKNRGNFWTDATTPNRSDVTKRMQKRKRFAKRVLDEIGFIDSILFGFGEFFLMQYTVDPAVLSGDTLAESQFDSAAFNAAYDHFAGVEAGDDTDLEIIW